MQQLANLPSAPSRKWAFPDLAWLTTHQEAVIEPEMEIVDSHHHLRDHDEPAMRARYLFHDLLEDVGAGHRVTASVVVETRAMYRAGGEPEMRFIGETEFFNGIAAMSASGKYGAARLCAGIMGMADLRMGDAVAPVLEAHVAAGGGRFRGIRHSTPWNASDEIPPHGMRPGKELLLDSTFRAGFARLRPLGLAFDSLIFHPQLPEVADLARAFPETTIIINHLGTPLAIGPYAADKAAAFGEWKAGIASLAGCGNVVMKLGGIGQVFSGLDYPFRAKPPSSSELAADWRPYIETCVELLGPDRCTFESNFPTDKVSFSYVVIWNAYKRIAAQYTAAEKAALFAGTARRAYRLDAHE